MDALVALLRYKKPIEGKLLDGLVIERSNLEQADRYAEIKSP
jgi:hypothetical protein